MSFSSKAPFAPGDVVRCVSVAGAGARFPLTLGHVYSVRARTEVDPGGAEPLPMVWLHGFSPAFAEFRFKLVTRATPEVNPVAAAVSRMAAVMVQCERESGGCTIDDLARAGFTSAQIIEYADEARAIAGAPTGLVAA